MLPGGEAGDLKGGGELFSFCSRTWLEMTWHSRKSDLKFFRESSRNGTHYDLSHGVADPRLDS